HPALSRLVAGRGARTLEELRLLDPAMGAGGFLLEALDLLEDAVRRAERRQQGALPAAPGGGDQRRRGAGAAEGLPLRCRLAARCLHGVDRDALAVDLTRYALWLHALGRCSPAEPLAEPPAEPHPERSRGRTGPPTGNAAILLPGHLAAGLRRGNALTVLARAATGGLPAFPRRFAAVLGNPPYVGERGHGEVLAEVRTSPLAAGSEGKMDLWHAFALLAEQLLDDGGVHSFVVPVYWVTAAGGRRLRAALLGRLELLELFTLDGWRPFARAPGQETMIYLARRPGAGEQRRDRPWRIRLAGAPERGGAGLGRGQGRERTELLLARWGADRRFAPAPVQLAIVVSGEASAPRRAAPVQLELAGLGEEVARAPQEDLRLVEQDLSRLREHVAAHAPLRLPAEAVRQGVVPNPARLARAGRGGGTEGVFVLTADELATLGPLSPLEQSLCVSFHPPREIPAMARLGPATQRLLYLTRDTLPDEAAAPRLLAHLQRFRPRLEQRREVQQGSLRWCDLHWPRERELFETPSLLSPRQCTAPRFAFSPGGAYVDLGVNVLRATTLERALGWPVEALLALLSSRVVCWWLAHCGKRKGAIYQVDRGPLLELPLPLPRPGPCAALAELGRQAVAEGGPSPGLLRLLEPIAGSLYGLQPEDEAWIGEQLAEERRA
ncbi:MAG: hypothetical protein FJ125_11490, partial [Deltaproteobacteria bacterium]|nr:hypothetical protein [Deltaproteobacteria bacterium]